MILSSVSTSDSVHNVSYVSHDTSIYRCLMIYVILALLLFEIKMSLEQRINLKFLVRRGKTPTKAHQVYGDNAMSKAFVFKWHKRFKERREEV